MMAEVVSIFVDGDAQPAGSKKAFAFRRRNSDRLGVSVVDDNKRAKPWKATVAAACRKAMTGEPAAGPISLTLIFVRRRPKGHFRSGSNAHLLRSKAPVRPITKPDTTKLVRCVEDALTGIAWADDAQVVSQFAEKRYGDRPGVMILVETLEEPCLV